MDVMGNDASSLLINISHFSELEHYSGESASTFSAKSLDEGALTSTRIAKNKHLNGHVSWIVSQVAREV